MNFKIADRDVFFKLRRLDKFMEGHKGYIAGGTFKNIFNNEKVRDVDVFFKNEDDFKKADKYFLENSEYEKHYNNENCHAYKRKECKTVVELVKTRFCEVEDLLKIFDFSIVKAAYYKEENEEGGLNYKIMYLDRFFEDLHQKKLVIDGDWQNIPHPVNTFNRTYKYQKYGFNLCRESKIKIIEMLRNLQGDIDLSNELYFGID
jgi:hypothetical protein